VILAIFYPAGEVELPIFFGCVALAIGLNLVLRRYDVKSFWAYVVFAGPLSWWGFHEGGIHPALALVPIIPTLPHASADVGLFAESELPEPQRRYDALNEFERFWRQPVEVVLMAFGFVNAGVVLGNVGVASGLVGVGLVLGKPIGITLFTMVSVKVLRLQMPDGMSFKDVVVLGTMAGIGFTVALFVATVAFPDRRAVLDAAKMGALFSMGASILSWIAARVLGVRRLAPGASLAPPATS
jgi:NhaA family Na+:H+ antiporter